jgi:hypothetical protein
MLMNLFPQEMENWPTDQTTDLTQTKPTNSMKQSLSWEANSHSASQEIPSLLQNPKVHCTFSLILVIQMQQFFYAGTTDSNISFNKTNLWLYTENNLTVIF